MLKILLDQNVPREATRWLSEVRSEWTVMHVLDLGFAGKSDDFLYQWAQENGFLIITYDEDFADARMYHLGSHHGVIRLRVWPTTLEMTCSALRRLLESIPEAEWIGALIIIDNQKIRVRRYFHL